MIRLILLIAIFFAVYPMIGEGYAQFTNDFDLQGLFDGVNNFIGNIVETIENWK